MELENPSHKRLLAMFSRELERLYESPKTVSERIREHLFGRLVYEATGEGCPCCQTWKPDVAVRRRNTAYCDDIRNYEVSCSECYDENAEYWADQWDDYYWNIGR